MTNVPMLPKWGGGIGSSGLLDYVCLWYFKAADYVRNTEIRCAFVSTNSITQGEQVGVLWGELFRRGVKIHFAHRTFAWQSEARGSAHVHVVIIGFGLTEAKTKTIFDYEQDPQNPQAVTVKNISPYLVEGSNTVITNRTTPLCTAPIIRFGNQPIDGGNFILEEDERDRLVEEFPMSAKWLRLYLGSKEFINNERRWCLWLKDAEPHELQAVPPVLKRIEGVRSFRQQSDRAATRDLTATPTRFAFTSHTDTEYLLIPSASSERRRYIPIGFLPSSVIASNLCLIIPGANRYHFGVITSSMHMAWVRIVCGRLKSDYRYSNKLVYNNYPWPEAPTDKQREAVEARAQAVLDARAQFPESSLADLYDPLTMPPVLHKAHAELDKAIEACYRKAAFNSDRERVEFLFSLYEKLTAPLTANLGTKKRKQATDD